MLDTEGWIPLADWCHRYKEKPNTVHKRIGDGAWPRGEMSSSPDGEDLYLHEAKCRAWLEKRGKLVL